MKKSFHRWLAKIVALSQHQVRQTEDSFSGGGKPLVKSRKREYCCSSHRLQRAGSNWQGSVNSAPSQSSQLIRADFGLFTISALSSQDKKKDEKKSRWGAKYSFPGPTLPSPLVGYNLIQWLPLQTIISILCIQLYYKTCKTFSTYCAKAHFPSENQPAAARGYSIHHQI